MTATLRLPVIVGPTASGKTRLGVDVAHRAGAEIVSADSRQVYRGLDVGSGKDLDEYRRVSPPVRHHLIDVADAHSIYTLYHYQRDCYRLLQERASELAVRDAAPLLMVGGTGLYVEAVLRGYRIANVPEDVALRDRLMRRSREALVRTLRERDPDLAGRTDCSSKKRVVRALEIADYAARHPLRYSEPPALQLQATVFVIDLPPEVLRGRIDLRLDARLADGLLEEVARLLDGGVSPERLAQLGLEYRDVAAHLLGDKSAAQMREDLRHAIHRLAKRQRTWFRGFPRRGIPVTTIGPDDAERVLAAF